MRRIYSFSIELHLFLKALPMGFNNLPSEIYSRIFEYLDIYKKDAFALMSVCKACHLPAKKRFYTEVVLTNRHGSFLTFLKSHQGDMISASIKRVYISDFWDAEEELNETEEFCFMIQNLKCLETLEIKAENTAWYLDIMLNHMQVEDLKQIKRVIISSNNNTETNQLFHELVYKLRDTITNFRIARVLPRQLKGNDPLVGLRYLSEFKNLAYLDIKFILPEGMEFFNILNMCPKLQNLVLLESSSTLSLNTSKGPVLTSTLKRLKLQLFQFPRHYVKYIISHVPPTIDYFELYVRDDGNNWTFSDSEVLLVDQFSAHLSKIKALKLILSRNITERTHQECLQMLTKTWHLANSIRGAHRRDKMVTSAEIKLVSNRGLEFQHYGHFTVRENNYFNFSVVFHLPITNMFDSNMNLGNVSTEDMDDLTMINIIKIKDERLPLNNTHLLHFVQYMVKRCTRLSIILVPNTNYTPDYIVFAPTAMSSEDVEEEEALPLRCATKSTRENILYASYSWMFLEESLLKSTLQMFPYIQTVNINGCDFEDSVIKIDLSLLKHLHRIELNLKQIYQMNSMLFAVHIANHGTVNYFFKRLIQGTAEKIGPFELASMQNNEQNCVVVNIHCIKANEMAIQWSYADQDRPTRYPSTLLPPCVMHPWSDLFGRFNHI